MHRTLRFYCLITLQLVTIVIRAKKIKVHRHHIGRNGMASPIESHLWCWRRIVSWNKRLQRSWKHLYNRSLTVNIDLFNEPTFQPLLLMWTDVSFENLNHLCTNIKEVRPAFWSMKNFWHPIVTGSNSNILRAYCYSHKPTDLVFICCLSEKKVPYSRKARNVMLFCKEDFALLLHFRQYHETNASQICWLEDFIWNWSNLLN